MAATAGSTVGSSIEDSSAGGGEDATGAGAAGVPGAGSAPAVGSSAPVSLASGSPISGAPVSGSPASGAPVSGALLSANGAAAASDGASECRPSRTRARMSRSTRQVRSCHQARGACSCSGSGRGAGTSLTKLGLSAIGLIPFGRAAEPAVIVTEQNRQVTTCSRPGQPFRLHHIFSCDCSGGPSGLVEEFGPLRAEQVGDGLGQRLVPGQVRVILDHGRGLLPGLTDQVLVGQQAEQLEAGTPAGLGRPEHVAFPALLQVEPGQAESVQGL